MMQTVFLGRIKGKKLFLFFGILILTVAVVVGFIMLKPDGNNDNTDDITSDTSSTEEVEENLPTATLSLTIK